MTQPEANITPHYKNCAVNHGSQNVEITKDGCMSGTLGAPIVPQTDEVTNAVSMKYKTFTNERPLRRFLVKYEKISQIDVIQRCGSRNKYI